MQIGEGTVGRVFVLRLEDGERLPDAVEAVARRRRIGAALVLLVGGARNGRLVTGPKRTVPVPDVWTRAFAAGHEMLGVGTLFRGETGPQLHLHAALGRRGRTLAGCIRLGIRAYLIAEIVILEIRGLRAARVRDPRSGFHLLDVRRGRAGQSGKNPSGTQELRNTT